MLANGHGTDPASKGTGDRAGSATTSRNYPISGSPTGHPKTQGASTKETLTLEGRVPYSSATERSKGRSEARRVTHAPSIRVRLLNALKPGTVVCILRGVIPPAVECTVLGDMPHGPKASVQWCFEAPLPRDPRD